MVLARNPLADDGCQVEDFLPQVLISRKLKLCASRITIDPLREKTPCQLLRYGDSGRKVTCRLSHEIPTNRPSAQKPLPAAFSGNGYQENGSRWRLNMFKGMRKTSQKTVQDGMIKLGSHNAGSIGRKSNLLLVMPSFRQFAGSIEPVQRCLFSCPAHVKGRAIVWVEGLMKISVLFCGRSHHIDQHRRTQTPVDGHALPIQTID